MTCEDCICTGSCAFVTKDEQPYFQAFRLAHRIPIGSAWKGYEFSAWISEQWSAWRRVNGLMANQNITTQQHAEFKDWLFERVGHPAARKMEVA